MIDKRICKNCKFINKIYDEIVFQKYSVFVDKKFINFFMVFKGKQSNGKLSMQTFKCSVDIPIKEKEELYLKIFDDNFSLSIRDVPAHFNNEIEKFINYENKKSCPYYVEHLLNNLSGEHYGTILSK